MTDPLSRLAAWCALALPAVASAQDAPAPEAPPSAAPVSAAAPASKAAAPASTGDDAPAEADPPADGAAAPASTDAVQADAPPADPAAPESAADPDAMTFEDAVEVPAPKPLPPMPTANDDFSADRGLFGDDVKTEPERFLKAELAAQDARVRGFVPLHERMPGFAYGAEAAAGLFGAGIVGLVGGSIGNAINDGDPQQPLGGATGGRVYGLLGGGLVGAAAGVWGGAVLFDKDTAPGWSILGSGIGSIVGGGAATGILLGIDDDNTASTLAVSTLFICQVVGALIFADLGMSDPPQ